MTLYLVSAAPSILRRHKASLGRKQVRFDAVTVYYFSRRQGFTSVPSQGGSSLGMARHHCAIRHYTLGEFAREQESSHKHVLRQHLRQEKLNARKLKVSCVSWILLCSRVAIFYFKISFTWLFPADTEWNCGLSRSRVAYPGWHIRWGSGCWECRSGRLLLLAASSDQEASGTTEGLGYCPHRCQRKDWAACHTFVPGGVRLWLPLLLWPSALWLQPSWN